MRVIGDAGSKFTAQSMSPAGTNRTNRAGLMMSVVRGRLEMAGSEAKWRFDPDRTPPRQHKRRKKRSLNLNGNYRSCRPSRCSRYHSTTIPDMTIVCIDILERILLGESQIERTGLLSWDIVASGLD